MSFLTNLWWCPYVTFSFSFLKNSCNCELQNHSRSLWRRGKEWSPKELFSPCSHVASGSSNVGWREATLWWPAVRCPNGGVPSLPALLLLESVPRPGSVFLLVLGEEQECVLFLDGLRSPCAAFSLVWLNLSNRTGKVVCCQPVLWLVKNDNSWNYPSCLGDNTWSRMITRVFALLWAVRYSKNLSWQVTWLILPVVICLSQRLSHACLSTSLSKVKPRMAH